MRKIIPYVLLTLFAFIQFSCCAFHYDGNLNNNEDFKTACLGFCGKKTLGEFRYYLKQICGYSVEEERVVRTNWDGFFYLEINLLHNGSSGEVYGGQFDKPTNISLNVDVYESDELVDVMQKNPYPKYKEIGKFDELDKCIIKSIRSFNGFYIH